MLGGLVLASLFSVGLCAGGWSVVTDSAKQAEYEQLLVGLGSNSLGVDCQTTQYETQVVAGLNIRYTKTCSNGDVCTFKVWQKTWENFLQITEHQCKTAKRQLAGGFSTVSSTDSSYSTYETWLSTYENNGQLSLPHYTVTKIESQVVQGMNIRYTLSLAGHECTIQIWDVPWLNKREITTDTCSVHKRQLGGMPGGFSTVSSTDSSYSTYESWLSTYEDNGQLSLPHYTITKIESQVVQGVNIKYTLSLAGHECTIQIWDVSWLNKREITTDTCSVHKRQLLGGYNKVDASEPAVQKCLSASLDKVNAMTNSMFRMVEGQVLDAEVQVVAGMNVKVRFTTATSSCMNNDMGLGKTAKDCPVTTNFIMTPSTFDAHCFISLDQQVKATVHME